MSANAIIAAHQIARPAATWVPVADPPLIGKDILELLSSSMYASALPIYREYIQNAADAIDEARAQGVLKPNEPGRVDITIDHDQRLVRIRDNGIGLGEAAFVERLISFGASKKRGTTARGFRGVGRLAGLGYCQAVTFRAKAAGEAAIHELRWDCRRLKTHLRNQQTGEELSKLVTDIVTKRNAEPGRPADHFFEVELAGIVRHGDDTLVDEAAISTYLSQVAPIPFAPSFRFGEQIAASLGPRVKVGNAEIFINGGTQPIYRPHRNEFEVRRGVEDKFSDLELVTIPASDGELAATGWVLHHSYLGAIPPRSNLGGLRLRSGNMQIGEADLLAELFPEPRFNSWVVGEIHVVDNRILVNGRRDYFEQNVHFHNVLNQLSPVAQGLARRCRSSSIRRNYMRQFDLGIAALKQRAAILRQRAITHGRRTAVKDEMEARFIRLGKIASSPILDSNQQKACSAQLKRLKTRFAPLFSSKQDHRKLQRFTRGQRRLIQKLFDVLYESADNEASARSLIEKILRRL